MNMQKGVLISLKGAACFVSLIFFIAGCETLDGTNTSTTSPVSASTPGKKTGGAQKVDGVDKGEYISEGPALVIEGEDRLEMNIFDRYEELLKQLVKREDEVRLLKEKIGGNEQEIATLKAELDEKNQGIEKGRGEMDGLRIANERLKEELGKMQAELEPHRKEVKGLKVDLLKAQIVETKAKQELIRLKTQYLIDKRRGGEGGLSAGHEKTGTGTGAEAEGIVNEEEGE